jgi:hypothetical protein
LATVSVPPARFSKRGEGSDIQPMIALSVELDRVPTDEQEGAAVLLLCLNELSHITVADGLSQLIERLSQALASFLIGLIGPQQAG